MLSSVALRAGELLAVGLVAAVVFVAMLAAGAVWLRRRVRRRLDVLGPVLAGRARGTAALAGSAGSRWLWSLPVPDRRWREGARARRELWRVVGAAEHAVAAARRGGAPTGDLAVLCRRLRQAAGSADRSLAIGQRSAVAGAGPEPAGCEVTDLLSAAGQIQSAASAALASMSRPAARELADDVRGEVVALSAGLASAAGTGRPRVPGLPG